MLLHSFHAPKGSSAGLIYLIMIKDFLNKNIHLIKNPEKVFQRDYIRTRLYSEQFSRVQFLKELGPNKPKSECNCKFIWQGHWKHLKTPNFPHAIMPLQDLFRCCSFETKGDKICHWKGANLRAGQEKSKKLFKHSVRGLENNKVIRSECHSFSCCSM